MMHEIDHRFAVDAQGPLVGTQPQVPGIGGSIDEGLRLHRLVDFQFLVHHLLVRGARGLQVEDEIARRREHLVLQVRLIAQPNRGRVVWGDHGSQCALARTPAMQENAAFGRQAVATHGLPRSRDLKWAKYVEVKEDFTLDYFEFFPACREFAGAA